MSKKEIFHFTVLAGGRTLLFNAVKGDVDIGRTPNLIFRQMITLESLRPQVTALAPAAQAGG